LLLFNLEDNKIDEKNIAFIDVGENTLFYIFFSSFLLAFMMLIARGIGGKSA
jgi:hypothetical protein